MSADNTILIMGFGDETYRVGHFQNTENLYWNEKSQSFSENLNLDMVQLFFGGLDSYLNYEDAFKEATILYEDVGYVEYGIRVIRTDLTWKEIEVYSNENE